MTKYRNVAVVDSGGMGPRLVFDSDAEHFHVWLDADTWQPRDDVLYANLIDQTTPRTRTRVLRVSSLRWSKVVARLLNSLDMKAERARIAREQAQEEAKHRAAVQEALRAARTRDVAPQLLESVRRWHQFAQDNGWTDADYHDADGSGWISRDAALLAEIDKEA